MIDLHSHILPGIDDGAKEMAVTMEMLQIAVKDGTKRIVATPHFYTGYYENTYEDVYKLVKGINVKAKEKEIDIDVVSGQEIFLDKHTLEFYKQGTIRGIDETKYMLIELSMESMPKDALNIIYELRIEGVAPIIAHPERYNYIVEKPSRINEFIEEGCFFQINSGSISGMFGKRIQKISQMFIQHGVCDFIASDAHSNGMRSPKMKETLEQVESLNHVLYENVIDNAEKLLNNSEIYSRAEKIKEKKGLFSFFKR